MRYFDHILNSDFNERVVIGGRIYVESGLRRALGLPLLEDNRAEEETGDFDFTFTKQFPTRPFGVVTLQYNPVSQELIFDKVPMEQIATVADGTHLYRLGLALYALKGSVSKKTLETYDGRPVNDPRVAMDAIRKKVKEMFHRETNIPMSKAV